MALMRAAALAPDAILLPADFDEYRRYSRLFKSAVADGAERRAVWAPRTFLHLPEIGNAVDAALDHAAVWVDLP